VSWFRRADAHPLPRRSFGTCPGCRPRWEADPDCTKNIVRRVDRRGSLRRSRPRR
jgi:hypothetical protein